MPALEAASIFLQNQYLDQFLFQNHLYHMNIQYSKYRALQKNMLVVQQADCEKYMHEVWVFRGQPPVYVPKLCTGPHISTTTNVVLINSSSIINLQYIISCSLTLDQVSTTVHPILIKPFEYHTTEVQSVQM